MTQLLRALTLLTLLCLAAPLRADPDPLPSPVATTDATIEAGNDAGAGAKPDAKTDTGDDAGDDFGADANSGANTIPDPGSSPGTKPTANPAGHAADNLGSGPKSGPKSGPGSGPGSGTAANSDTPPATTAYPTPIRLDNDRDLFWRPIAPSAEALREAGCCLTLQQALATPGWHALSGPLIHADRLIPPAPATAAPLPPEPTPPEPTPPEPTPPEPLPPEPLPPAPAAPNAPNAPPDEPPPHTPATPNQIAPEQAPPQTPPPGPVWVRVAVHNSLDRAARWLIDTRTPRFGAVTLYRLPPEARPNTHPNTPPDIAPRIVLDLKQDSPFAARPIPHRHIMANLDLAAGETATLVLRYIPIHSAPVDLRVAAFDPVWGAETAKSLWSGIFYGSVIGAVIFVLMAVPLLGRAISLPLGGLMASGLIWSLTETGVLHQIGLIDDQMTVLRLAGVFLHLTCAGALVLTMVMFRLDRWAGPLRLTLALQLGTALACLALLPGGTVIGLLSAAAYALTLGSCIGVGLHAIRTGQGGGWPILLASLLMGTVSLGLRLAFDNLPGPVDAHEVNRTLLSVVSIAFATALIGRVTEIRKARDRAITAELASTAEQLRLSRALRDRERDYDRYRRAAERRQAQVETLSHDLVQPLAALRTALHSAMVRPDIKPDTKPDTTPDTKPDTHPGTSPETKPETTPPDDRIQHVQNAIDYLQTVAQGLLGDADDAPEPPDTTHETFPATAVLDNVHAMFEDEIAARGLTFRYTRSDAHLAGDPILLIRALGNLIVNALRYTETGELHLFARPLPDGRTMIGVTDTGCGMTPDQAARCLDRGQKAADSPGQGLGLASVADSARAMNATLDIDTAPGRGTTITLTFPAVETAP